MKRRVLYACSLLLLMLLSIATQAQKKITLSGYIKDASSGESLIGATVFIKDNGLSASTNQYGFYSVSTAPGTYTVVFAAPGYRPSARQIDLSESRAETVELSSREMAEVEITAQRKDEHVTGTEMGTITLTADAIKKLPVIFGETDILKALQLLPGVQSAGEGNSGFYVRGGGPDQNLILLDDAVVYNTGHLFGFFSVFNSDAIKSTTLIKGGMPANFGGRLSSVVDVSMKEGNLKEYHAEGGIGLIASRLTLEGPIKKEKGSFMLSGRRTYIDVLTRPFVSDRLKGSGYYFYDANLKANYILNPKNRVYLSGYFGRDRFAFQSPSQTFKVTIPWGNSTATARWNHQFSDRLFVNTSLVYNDYNFSFNGEQTVQSNGFSVKLYSGIRDYNAKSDFDYYTSFNHHFKAGFAYTWHKFTPNQVSGHSDTISFNPDNSLIKYAHEAAAYVLDEFEPWPWLRVNAGLRFSSFIQAGPYKQYTYDPTSNNTIATDSTEYATGAAVKSYGGPEPRLNLRFRTGAASSIKASLSRSFQYIHLVSNNGSTLPTDTWVPSTFRVKPQESWQYAVGYFKNFLDNALETSVEVYYKKMKNQIEYREGYTPNSLRDQELDFVFGSGEAYGAEFFINKTKGKFTGWIGYTLSWTYRTFPQLNNGNPYPAKYDRRHDLSIVATYEHSKRWTFSSVFVFGSGNAITLPTSYNIMFESNSNNLVQNYSGLNEYRLFPYHRLDLSAILTPKHKAGRRWQSSWAFSVYNAYNRMNPYFLYVDTKGNAGSGNGVDVSVKQVSIFPVLPSVTYNFKF